jgi:exopolyphosphatase/guanosine-5'-triphosphate,3'-diphosphate pyrophosphatase
VDKRSMREAELAARTELQTIEKAYRQTGWEEAVGSSGTAKAIVDLLELNGMNRGDERGIERHGLEQLRELLVRSGDAARLPLEGLRADRMPVLPGGIAIMSAVFKEFGLERMTFSEGALRLGVLYDLLGRHHHEDLREATVEQFVTRYEADPRQARRVAQTALALLRQVLPEADEPDEADGADSLCLSWAAHLHEIGISVAHSSYHKHSAYIIANADMPGFSRRDQARMARLVLAHRGKLERVLASTPDARDRLLILCLRLAALLHRVRDDEPLPDIELTADGPGFQVAVPADWLQGAPLTAAALEDERRQWEGLGMPLRLKLRKA